MNVGELRAALEGLPDDVLVVQSIDPEGNGFRPTRTVEAENNLYDESYPGMGTVSLQRLTTELAAAGYAAEDVGEGTPCVVIWP